MSSWLLPAGNLLSRAISLAHGEDQPEKHGQVTGARDGKTSRWIRNQGNDDRGSQQYSAADGGTAGGRDCRSMSCGPGLVRDPGVAVRIPMAPLRRKGRRCIGPTRQWAVRDKISNPQRNGTIPISYMLPTQIFMTLSLTVEAHNDAITPTVRILYDLATNQSALAFRLGGAQTSWANSANAPK